MTFFKLIHNLISQQVKDRMAINSVVVEKWLASRFRESEQFHMIQSERTHQAHHVLTHSLVQTSVFKNILENLLEKISEKKHPIHE